MRPVLSGSVVGSSRWWQARDANAGRAVGRHRAWVWPEHSSSERSFYRNGVIGAEIEGKQ